MITTVFFFGVWCGVLSSQREGTSSLETIQLNQCGINSLYLCLKYHGLNVPLEDLYGSIRPDAQNNVSLKQLGDHAKRKGLYVQYRKKPGSRTVQKDLQKNRSVIIQYQIILPDNSIYKHIAVLIKPDRKIILLDYPNTRQEVSLQDLAFLDENSEGMFLLSPKPIGGLEQAVGRLLEGNGRKGGLPMKRQRRDIGHIGLAMSVLGLLFSELLLSCPPPPCPPCHVWVPPD